MAVTVGRGLRVSGGGRGVTVTLAEVQSMFYRAGQAPDRPELFENIYNAAVQAVTDHGPDAPSAIADRAVVMVTGYMDDAPFGPRKYDRMGDQATIWDTTRATNALRMSGAAALLSRYRVRRAL